MHDAENKTIQSARLKSKTRRFCLMKMLQKLSRACKSARRIDYKNEFYVDFFRDLL